MELIQTTDNFVIETGSGFWRLTNGQVGDPPLLVAIHGKTALSYPPGFSRTKRLPPAGKLPLEDIAQVVVGWSHQESAWQLGLILSPQLAEARGGRWCFLARWASESPEQYAGKARFAGHALAAMIGRPFRFVRPRGQEAPAPPTQPARPVGTAAAAAPQEVPIESVLADVTRIRREAAEAALRLPIQIGAWLFRRIDLGLEWRQTSLRSMSAVWQIIFRLVLGIIFILVSGLTLTSRFASVQPNFLPYIGLVVGLGTIVSGILITWRMLRSTALVIDTSARQVRDHLNLTNDVIDSYDFDEIKAVVVTQVAQQKKRGRGDEPDVTVHEAWLHLLLHEPRQIRGKYRNMKPADAYVTIGHIEGTEGVTIPAHYEGNKRSRVPQRLYADEVSTPVSQVAFLMARAIGVDPYIDQR